MRTQYKATLLLAIPIPVQHVFQTFETKVFQNLELDLVRFSWQLTDAQCCIFCISRKDIKALSNYVATSRKVCALRRMSWVLAEQAGGILWTNLFWRYTLQRTKEMGQCLYPKRILWTSWSIGRLLAYIWTKEGHFYRTENKTFDKRLNCICNILHTCNQIIHWKIFTVEDFDPRMVTTSRRRQTWK